MKKLHNVSGMKGKGLDLKNKPSIFKVTICDVEDIVKIIFRSDES